MSTDVADSMTAPAAITGTPAVGVTSTVTFGWMGRWFVTCVPSSADQKRPRPLSATCSVNVGTMLTSDVYRPVAGSTVGVIGSRSEPGETPATRYMGRP